MAETSILAIREGQDWWDEKQIAALQQLGITGAGKGDLALFLAYAQKTGLDPFSRQIYMIQRGGKWGIQASIDGLRIVAQRSGEYAGQVGPMWCDTDGVWVDVWLKSTPPAAAKVGVWRKGFSEPAVAVALWSEYAATGGVWKKMPALMLAKCAEALALRKAFPHDLSGIYTSDEMAQADDKPAKAPVKAAPAVAAAPAEAPADEVLEGEVVPSLDPTAIKALIDLANITEDTDSLRGLWKEATAEGILDTEVDGTTLRAVILARKEALA